MAKKDLINEIVGVFREYLKDLSIKELQGILNDIENNKISW
jgi:hypothetical protein